MPAVNQANDTTASMARLMIAWTCRGQAAVNSLAAAKGREELFRERMSALIEQLTEQRKDGSDDDRDSRGDEQAVLHEMFLLPAAGARTSTSKRAERMLASGMRIAPVRTTAVV